MSNNAVPDYGGYSRARGDVNYRYSADSANNAYGRFLSQQRGSRNLGDMSRNFSRQMPSYTASFGQRGLSGGGINSGAMQQSMRNYIGDYGRQYGRVQQDATQQLQQFDLNQANLDAWRQAELSDIRQREAMDTANTATQLDYLRQMVGGL